MLEQAQRIEPTLSNIFDATSDWKFAPVETCKRGRLSPNGLAYCETTATLALIVKRSLIGTDFALSEAGLNLLLAAFDKGERKDGKPVRNAVVILAQADAGQQRSLKVVCHASAHRTRDHLNGRATIAGFNGPYWWITPEVSVEAEDVWM